MTQTKALDLRQSALLLNLLLVLLIVGYLIGGLFR